MVLGLWWQRRLEHGDVAEVAGRARGRHDAGLDPSDVGQVDGRTRGQPQRRGVVPRRHDRQSRVVGTLDRASGCGGSQDPPGEALAAPAADVRHALAQAPVQRQEEHRVHEGVHVRYVERYLRNNNNFFLFTPNPQPKANLCAPLSLRACGLRLIWMPQRD